ncbi:hypothetical protein HDU67_004077, partial [Dinochytrium kinnereticum]
MTATPNDTPPLLQLPIEILHQTLEYLHPHQIHYTFRHLTHQTLHTLNPTSLPFTTQNLLNLLHTSLQDQTLFTALSLPTANLDLLRPLRSLHWWILPNTYAAALFLLLGFGSKTLNLVYPECFSRLYARPRPYPDLRRSVEAVVEAVEGFEGRFLRGGGGSREGFPVLGFVDESVVRLESGEEGFDHVLRLE